MKSHELAKNLMTLAKILKSGKDVDIDELSFSQFSLPKSANASINEDEIPHALNMLVSLNNVEKHQWLSLIEEFGFEIDVRHRDAKRDIVGKLLNYLTDNPEERKRLTGGKTKTSVKASAELSEALSILLK